MKFRMVDRILSWEPRTRICGTKTVSFEEYNCKAAFGGDACLPESLLVESLFQLGNWLIVLTSDFTQMGLVVRMSEIRFEDQVRPGSSLRLEVEAAAYRSDGVLLNGRALCGDRIVGIGTGCLATSVALADYCNPDDLKVLFGEIYRPVPQEGA